MIRAASKRWNQRNNVAAQLYMLIVAEPSFP